MQRLIGSLAALTALAASAAPAFALSTSPAAYRTPQGWLLRPAGEQVDTRRSPDGLALAPGGKTVYAVSNGQFDHALTSFDAAALVPEHLLTGELFMGVAADGEGHVWASGGSSNRIWQFRAVGPATVPARQASPFPGAPSSGIRALGYPAAMLLDPVAKRLYVAGNLSVPQRAIDAFDPRAGACPGGQPVCSVIHVVDVSNPSETATPPVSLIPVGRDAYGLALDRARQRLYVTNWADEVGRGAGSGTVSVVDLATGRELRTLAVGRHPTGIALSPDGSRLAVADSADDTLHVFPIAAGGTIGAAVVQDVRTPLTTSPTRGVTPLALAYSPAGDALYVAEAGINAVEVRAPDGAPLPRTVAARGGPVTVPGSYVPAGWYPSALASAGFSPTAGASRLYVANLKGMGAGPGFFELVTGARSQGTVSAIDVPDARPARERALAGWTLTVAENNGWLDDLGTDAACRKLPDAGRSEVLCRAATDPEFARQLHVVYVVKENKTFDQYFGDIKPTLPDANASPEWLLYGREVTTNQHRLAERFVLNDNFWADSEQSTTGHSWTSAGYATDFNELTWSTSAGYDLGARGDRWGGQYDGQFSGPRDPEVARGEAALAAPAERLVDRFADPATNPGGFSFRIYSDDVEEGSPAAADRVPLDYWGIRQSAVNRGRDLDFPDTDRADIFLTGSTVSHAWSADGGPPPPTYGKRITLPDAARERFTLAAWTARYEACRDAGNSDAACQSAMPNFLYMALPVDHTLGFNPGNPTPQSMVADNDYAFGRIVEGLSRSPFWKRTLVIAVEDDTQASGDHVDGHRTFALAAGGLARRLGPDGRVSHQEGSFPSVLKTVETLFGIPPLTVYDRAAAPLTGMLVKKLKQADGAPGYTAVKPPVPFARNPDATQLAALSQQMDWRLDRTDPELLGDLLYAGLRGRPLNARARARLSPAQRALPLSRPPLPGRR